MRDIVISEYGVALRYSKGKIVVRRVSGEKREYPMYEVRGVIALTSGVSVSTRLLMELSRKGKFFAVINTRDEDASLIMLPAVPSRTVTLRREQYLAEVDVRGLEIAKAVIKSKVLGQSNVLRYFGHSRNVEDAVKAADRLREIAAKLHSIQGLPIRKGVKKVMEVEAEAASIYWENIAKVVNEAAGFRKRVKRGARDPVNIALNIGYGYLRAVVASELLARGFDPYLGYIHTEKSGRQALALDVMEVFRPVIDKAVIAYINKHSITKEVLDERYRAPPQLRKEILKTVKQELDERRVREVIDAIAEFLLGERPSISLWHYSPWRK